MKGTRSPQSKFDECPVEPNKRLLMWCFPRLCPRSLSSPTLCRPLCHWGLPNASTLLASQPPPMRCSRTSRPSAGIPRDVLLWHRPLACDQAAIHSVLRPEPSSAPLPPSPSPRLPVSCGFYLLNPLICPPSCPHLTPCPWPPPGPVLDSLFLSYYAPSHPLARQQAF